MDVFRRSKTIWFVTFLAACGLVVASACGGDDKGDSGGSTSNPAPADQQVLRLNLLGEPSTIDPHLAAVNTEYTIARQLFSGLLTYNSDLEIVAALASEVPTVENGGISDDGLVYTVKLIDDAKWSDGTAITAGDFVYSMLRALDPELASPYASFFYGIKGAAEYNSALGEEGEGPKPPASEIEDLRKAVGVRAVDERTIEYTLLEPNPSFLNLLALWTASPVRQDIVEKYRSEWTEAGNHIGNGPFVISSWEHNQKLVMEPNPYWYGEKPVLKRLEVTFVDDASVAYQRYQNGELDVVKLPRSLGTEALKPGSALADETIVTPNVSTTALFMNNAQAPFDNRLVRQAFAMAIDRDALVTAVLQNAGHATTSWLPPGMPGYDAEIGSQYKFNPDSAKALLSQAGYKDGAGFPSTTFMLLAGSETFGEFYKAQLKANLGIDVDFVYYDENDYFPRFIEGDYQVTMQSWFADWPYPDNWLPTQFTSGSPNNVSFYSNEKFDALMDQAAGELDDAKRIDLYKQGQKTMLDDAGLSPLYNGVNITLVNPRVKQLVATGLDGALTGDFFFWKTFIAAE
jgi:oligopeptide transport system substrate-binding protein